MSGPWEQYQAQAPQEPQSGPWTAYQAAPAQQTDQPRRQPQRASQAAPAPQPEAPALRPLSNGSVQDYINAGMLPTQIEREVGDISPEDAQLLAEYRAMLGRDDPGATVLRPGDPGYPTPEGARDRYYPEQGFAVRETPGYLAALQREQERAEVMRGVGGPNFGNQPTAFLNDELAGLGALGSQAVENLLRSLRGDPVEIRAGEAGRAAMDYYRQRQRAFEQEHPLQAAGGQVLGGFAFAPARLGNLGRLSGLAGSGAQNFARPGLIGNALEITGTGAAIGAADAEGGLGERVEGAARGAGVGLLAAGALRGAGAAIERGAGAIGSVRNGPRMSSSNRRVAQAVERALQRDRVAVPDALASVRNGDLPFEVSRNMQLMAEAVAQSPGPGGRLVEGTIQDRAANASARIREALAQGTGAQGDYFAQLDGIVSRAAERAGPLRQRAFATPIDPAVFRSTVEPIMSRLPPGALDEAASLARMAGRNPEELGFIMERVPGGGSRAIQVRNPTLETLDFVKRGIDQTLAPLRNPVTGRLDLSGNPRAQEITRVREALGRAMREVSDDYDQAMRIFGDEFAQRDALELGRTIFSNAGEMSAERLRARVEGMSDAERAMFQRGVGEELLNRVRQRGGVQAMRQLVKNDEFKDRVRLAFADDAAFEQFIGAAEREVRRANAANKVLGGSQTGQRLATREDLEAGGFGADALDALSSAADLKPVSALRATGRLAARAASGAMRKHRGLLSNDETNELLGRAAVEGDTFARLLEDLMLSRRGATAAKDRARPLAGLLRRPPAGVAAQTGQQGLGLLGLR